MNNRNIDFYEKNADNLCDLYDSISTEDVHGHILSHIPSDAMILDIGCGSGRDAFYFAKKGYCVVAVDPSIEMLSRAKANYQHENLIFLHDSLPELNNIKSQYDIILMSAVWMHIPLEDRSAAMEKIMSLLKPQGKAIISLRHGQFNDDRLELPVSVDELNNLTEFDENFSVQKLKSDEDDKFDRNGVRWKTVILKNNHPEIKRDLKIKKPSM